MRSFLTCTRGNMAVMFSVCIIPVMGAAGMAVDYSRAVNVHSFMQAQADIAALRGAQFGAGGDAGAVIDYVRFVAQQRYGEGRWVEGLSVEGNWLTPRDYRVTVAGELPVTILSAVPGFPEAVPIRVRSTVRMAEPRQVYKPPTVSELDNEAGDYNRVYIYCFDPEDKDDPATRGRTQMTVIADNAGTKYTYEMPRCDADQMLSYKLLNVRLAREEPKKWDDPRALRFEYFTDTVLKNGAEIHDLGGWQVLETVLCANLRECKPRSQGGIIPEGKNRTPVQAKEACSPGKYMYYGWEDRPPGMSGPSNDWTDIAWTDTDYDDIRIIIECPSVEEVEERSVRLVD